MKFELKKMSEDDLEFLLEVRNHESTRYNLENDSVFDIDQCKKWFKSLTSPWYIIKVEGERVGYLRTSGNEVGCDIHPNFRRKGYARMAYESFLQGAKTASLWVFEDNFARKLYEDLGFVPTGEIKTIRGRNYMKMILEK